MGILRTLFALIFAIVGAVILVAAFLVAFVGFFLGGIIIVVAFLIAVVGFLFMLTALALVFFAPYFQAILAACIITTICVIKKRRAKRKKILEERDGIEIYVEDPNATYVESEETEVE